MKIIHILPGKANPETQNGVNKVVDSLANEQLLSGHDVIVYGVANNNIKRHHPNYKLHLIKKSKYIIIPPLKLLKELCKYKKNTIIHLHSAFIPWFPLLAIYLRIIGFKFILTPHGVYISEKIKNRFLLLTYFYLVESVVLTLSSKIHILGISEKNRYTNIFLRNKHVLIHNGCNHINKNCEISDRLIFGFLGRLKIDHKGLDILIDAFNLYLERGGKGKLLIAGDGPDKCELELKVKKTKNKSKIEFLGPIFGDDKISFYNQLSYFIHTSRWEGFPMSCVEAASNCIPLLVSEPTNMGYIINKYDSGIVLKYNNIQNIMYALFKLENNFYTNNYSTMRKNTSEMVEKELTWKVISEKITKNLYLNL